MMYSPNASNLHLIVAAQNIVISHSAQLPRVRIDVLHKTQTHLLLKRIAIARCCGFTAKLTVPQNGLTTPAPHIDIRIVIVEQQLDIHSMYSVCPLLDQRLSSDEVNSFLLKQLPYI